MKDFLYWTFVRCWPLGEKCEVNWDAWAAIGALAAVVVALRIANMDKLRRWDEADARAGVAYAKLLQPLKAWQESIEGYSDLIRDRDLAFIRQAIDVGSLRWSAHLVDSAGEMRDLGPATEAVLEAFVRSEQASSLDKKVLKIVASPELTETPFGRETLAEYEWSVRMAYRAARAATGLMSSRLDRVTKKTRWKTRYEDELLERWEREGTPVKFVGPRAWISRRLFNLIARPLRRLYEEKPFKGR